MLRRTRRKVQSGGLPRSKSVQLAWLLSLALTQSLSRIQSLRHSLLRLARSARTSTRQRRARKDELQPCTERRSDSGLAAPTRRRRRALPGGARARGAVGRVRRGADVDFLASRARDDRSARNRSLRRHRARRSRAVNLSAAAPRPRHGSSATGRAAAARIVRDRTSRRRYLARRQEENPLYLRRTLSYLGPSPPHVAAPPAGRRYLRLRLRAGVELAPTSSSAAGPRWLCATRYAGREPNFVVPSRCIVRSVARGRLPEHFGEIFGDVGAVDYRAGSTTAPPRA